jgi:hypothetical protein
VLPKKSDCHLLALLWELGRLQTYVAQENETQNNYLTSACQNSSSFFTHSDVVHDRATHSCSCSEKLSWHSLFGLLSRDGGDEFKNISQEVSYCLLLRSTTTWWNFISWCVPLCAQFSFRSSQVKCEVVTNPRTT